RDPSGREASRRRYRRADWYRPAWRWREVPGRMRARPRAARKASRLGRPLKIPCRTASRAQDDLTHRLAFGDVLECRRDFGQRVDGMDVPAQLAFGTPAHDLGHQRALAVRIALRP